MRRMTCRTSRGLGCFIQVSGLPRPPPLGKSCVLILNEGYRVAYLRGVPVVEADEVSACNTQQRTTEYALSSKGGLDRLDLLEVLEDLHYARAFPTQQQGLRDGRSMLKALVVFYQGTYHWVYFLRCPKQDVLDTYPEPRYQDSFSALSTTAHSRTAANCFLFPFISLHSDRWVEGTLPHLVA